MESIINGLTLDDTETALFVVSVDNGEIFHLETMVLCEKTSRKAIDERKKTLKPNEKLLWVKKNDPYCK